MVKSTFILYDKEYTVSLGDIVTVNYTLDAQSGQKAILCSSDDNDTIYCELTEVTEDYYTFVIEKIVRKYKDGHTQVFSGEVGSVSDEVKNKPNKEETDCISFDNINIDTMTKSKLIEFAKENNISVKPAMKKADILDIIKKELGM